MNKWDGYDDYKSVPSSASPCSSPEASPGSRLHRSVTAVLSLFRHWHMTVLVALKWFKAESSARCLHVNGWRNVLDDGRHDVLVRECADCSEQHSIRQASPTRWWRHG